MRINVVPNQGRLARRLRLVLYFVPKTTDFQPQLIFPHACDRLDADHFPLSIDCQTVSHWNKRHLYNLFSSENMMFANKLTLIPGLSETHDSFCCWSVK